MPATVCTIKQLKPRRALDHASTLLSDRTARLTSFVERLMAQSGIPVPDHLNLKTILDAVQGKIGWTRDMDIDTHLNPLNDAIAAAAVAAGEEYSTFKDGVSNYIRLLHLDERIRTMIIERSNTKKLFTKIGLVKLAELKNKREDFNNMAGEYTPEQNEAHLMEILTRQEDLFDPANEALYFAETSPGSGKYKYKTGKDYEGLNLAEVEELLKISDPKYERFYDANIDKFDAIRDTLAQRRMDSEYNGPIKEFTRRMRGWKHYMPFKTGKNANELENFMDDFDVFESTGYLNDTDPDLMKGRTSLAADPLEQLELDLLRSGKTLHDSLVSRTLLDLVEMYGSALTNVTISEPFNTTAMPNAPNVGKRPSGAKKYQPGKIGRKPNTIIAHKGDRAYVLEISDPDLFNGIKNYWTHTNELANNIYKYTLKPLGALKTKYNAPWGFYTNFIREFRNQLIYGTLELGYDDNNKFSFDLSKSYLKNVLAFGGFRDALQYHTRDYLGKLQLEAQGSDYAKWANKLVSLGGESTFLQSLDLNDVRQNMEDAYLKVIGGPPKSKDALLARIRRADKTYEGMINGVDLSTRVALFKSIVESGKMGEQEAAIYVKNLMNFNYRGKYGDVLRAMFIFYGPSAAGVFRMLHTFVRSKNPAQTRALMLWHTGSIGVAYMLANMALGEDDDGEDLLKKVDDYTLIKHTVLPVIGDSGSMTIISRALGLETLLAAPGILAVRYLLGHTNLTKASVAMAKTALDNSTFVSPADPGSNVNAESILTAAFMTGTPSLIRPITEAAFNTTSQGLQIYNPYIDPNTPKYLQGRDNTDQLFKDASEFLYNWLGDFGDFTPETLKHNFMQYGGIISTTANRMISWNDKVMRGDPMTLTDIPLMPTMQTKDVIYYPQRIFADTRQEWRLGLKGMKVAEDRGEIPDPLDVVADSLDSQVTRYDRAIKKQIRGIRESDLPEQEKANRIRVLKEQQNMMRQQLVKQWQHERDSQ